MLVRGLWNLLHNFDLIISFLSHFVIKGLLLYLVFFVYMEQKKSNVDGDISKNVSNDKLCS